MAGSLSDASPSAAGPEPDSESWTRQPPDAGTAAAIATEVLGVPARARRFETGLRHYVFDVQSERGPAVVRLSRAEDAKIARDALYWSEMLRPLGVPLPRVLDADTTMQRFPFPYLVLECLAGRDLAYVIDRLSQQELGDLAQRLASVQAIVGGLPTGRGYGFTARLEGPFPQATWADSVSASLARSRGRIRRAGVVDERLCDEVEAAADSLTCYFDSVPGDAFPA